LGAYGYAVSVVEDGLSAIERLRAEPPQLMILDLMLPGRGQ
jgi:DNA-binding response OmpR family regulator